jgi:hypothetical protein
VKISPIQIINLVFFPDFPLNGDEISSVIIDIQEVQVYDKDGNSFIVNEEPIEVDLLMLVNNVTALIGEDLLPSGEYNEIRLILGNNNRVIADGDEEPLKVPSGQQSGIKIKGEFELKDGRITQVQLDFQADKSIHYNSGQGYILRPVIKITSAASFTIEQAMKIHESMGEWVDTFLEGSCIIFQVKVVELVSTEWEKSSFGFYFAYEYWKVNVLEVIKGPSMTEYTIRVPGGTIGDSSYSVSVAADFKVGDKSIIFLKNFNDVIGVNSGYFGKIDL